MNEELLQRLSNPVYDLDEAQELMRVAAQEIYRLNKRLVYMNDCILKLRDENDRLSLDLGLKERGYTQ